MGAVKNLFIEVEESLNRGDYARALELLKPWGDDAPRQLWATLEAISQDGSAAFSPNWNYPVTIPVEISAELYDTGDLVKIFSHLKRQGYESLSLGLVIDLVRQER